MTPSRSESYICNSKPLHKRTCIFEKLHINHYFHTLHSISHNSTHTLQLLPLFATFKHLGCHTSAVPLSAVTVSARAHTVRCGHLANYTLQRRHWSIRMISKFSASECSLVDAMYGLHIIASWVSCCSTS
jgi:hypothetical protein